MAAGDAARQQGLHLQGWKGPGRHMSALLVYEGLVPARSALADACRRRQPPFRYGLMLGICAGLRAVRAAGGYQIGSWACQGPVAVPHLSRRCLRPYSTPVFRFGIRMQESCTRNRGQHLKVLAFLTASSRVRFFPSSMSRLRMDSSSSSAEILSTCILGSWTDRAGGGR